MNNFEKAIELITVYNLLYSVNEYIPLKTALQAIEMASKPNWKYPAKNEYPNFDGIILAFSKSKQIVKPISYINDDGTKSWLKLNFEAWCELPVFNNS